MSKSNHHTLKEIHQQPRLWNEVVELLQSRKAEIDAFLTPVLSQRNIQIIFTGAGSSFFIGEMVAPLFTKETGLCCKAVQTTELVTHPHCYLSENHPCLLISFARSGNSPESVAAVANANKLVKQIHHIFITCNAEGALARTQSANSLAIVLPEAANDKGLAMTSSVTGMALTAWLLNRLDRLTQMSEAIKKAGHMFERFFEKHEDHLRQLANVAYDRAVCLGSGPMIAVAREAHLKLQELTDGKIICKYDSFLGFRHGPKAVVNDRTLVVYFFSNDDYVRQYEKDLVESMTKEHKMALTIGISNRPLEVSGVDVMFNLEDTVLEDALWMLTALVPMQLLAYYKSLEMGFNPDEPSVSGAISRVVRGVSIYSFQNSTNGQ